MVELFFVEAIYEGDISVTAKLKEYLLEKKPKMLALFASVQFAHLDNFRKEIEKMGIKIKTTKAKRTAKPLQILGCDSYNDSFQEDIISESDIILYVGDGLFHPKALLLAQTGVKKIKPIVLYDPIAQTVKEISYKDIEKQLLRAKANIRKFMNADSIGILVTIKPGQQYFTLAKQLKEKLIKQGKKAYIFIDNTIDLKGLENYPFVTAWVNTACPRIGTDDIVNITQPMINI
ncbi:MAG: diphthamide synthesis protein, partial [Nanoarchaeota archaeon]